MKIYILNRYKERMSEAISLLGGQCVKCETKEELQLDHINRETKSFTIGKMWSIAYDKFFRRSKEMPITLP